MRDFTYWSSFSKQTMAGRWKRVDARSESKAIGPLQSFCTSSPKFQTNLSFNSSFLLHYTYSQVLNHLYRWLKHRWCSYSAIWSHSFYQTQLQKISYVKISYTLWIKVSIISAIFISDIYKLKRNYIVECMMVCIIISVLHSLL